MQYRLTLIASLLPFFSFSFLVPSPALRTFRTAASTPLFVRDSQHIDDSNNSGATEVGRFANALKPILLSGLGIGACHVVSAPASAETIISDTRQLSESQSSASSSVFVVGLAAGSYVLKKSCDRENAQEIERVKSELESYRKKKAEFFNVSGEVESDEEFMKGLREAAKNVTGFNATGTNGDDSGWSGGGGGGPSSPSPSSPPEADDAAMASDADVERLKKLFGSSGNADQPNAKEPSRSAGPSRLGNNGLGTGAADRPGGLGDKRSSESMTPEKPSDGDKLASDEEIERLKKLFGGGK